MARYSHGNRSASAARAEGSDEYNKVATDFPVGEKIDRKVGDSAPELGRFILRIFRHNFGNFSAPHGGIEELLSDNRCLAVNSEHSAVRVYLS